LEHVIEYGLTGVLSCVQACGKTAFFLGGVSTTSGYHLVSSWKIHSTSDLHEPWSILTIWLMVIPSIIRILIMVIINPYEPLDD
jgi:hypothetical protein